MSLLLAGASASAGDLYQWKDANGVTHYSQTPPASGSYKERSESGRATAAAPVDTAAAKPAEPAECTTARANVALLEGKAALQQDTDGDGKPDKTLDDAERASQLELARAVIKARCTATATAAN
ncbi:MAG TPA: DUF4124 domain-containing protein [Luteimonas sp.]|nr:DUF4124 domain-containing protein [Luteimonas sp.]